MIKRVILDAGHGGLKNGVYQTKGKMFKFPDGVTAYEGDFNRKMVVHISEILKDNGVEVCYTVNPTDPTDMPLADRVRSTNMNIKEKTVFVSIHGNAGGGEGFEIFTTEGKTNSDILSESIALAVENTCKSWLKMRWDKADGDRDKEEHLYVCAGAKCPAVLIECMFFDSRKDWDNINKPENFDLMAKSIAHGIIAYFG